MVELQCAGRAGISHQTGAAIKDASNVAQAALKVSAASGEFHNHEVWFYPGEAVVKQN